MTLAVLADVLVVRILPGTAVMKLLGRAAWWAPGPLARFYDRFGIKETACRPTKPPTNRSP